MHVVPALPFLPGPDARRRRVVAVAAVAGVLLAAAPRRSRATCDRRRRSDTGTGRTREAADQVADVSRTLPDIVERFTLV
jgi:hypothetical protein